MREGELCECLLIPRVDLLRDYLFIVKRVLNGSIPVVHLENYIITFAFEPGLFSVSSGRTKCWAFGNLRAVQRERMHGGFIESLYSSGSSIEQQ